MQKRAYLVPLIILLNILVFGMWMRSEGAGDTSWMEQNFLVSWDGLRDGRYWTLWTSAFSHNLLFHILINMFVLNSFGSLLEQVLGSWTFLKFYFLAAAISSLTHGVVSAFVLSQPELPALGASGAVAGLVLLFSFMFPREKILIFGFIPIPALWGALVFVGLDLWGLFAQAEGGGLPIGHGAHLGGAFTGILFYFFSVRRRLR